MFHCPGVNATSKARQRALSLSPPQHKRSRFRFAGLWPSTPIPRSHRAQNMENNGEELGEASHFVISDPLLFSLEITR